MRYFCLLNGSIILDPVPFMIYNGSMLVFQLVTSLYQKKRKLGRLKFRDPTLHQPINPASFWDLLLLPSAIPTLEVTRQLLVVEWATCGSVRGGGSVKRWVSAPGKLRTSSPTPPKKYQPMFHDPKKKHEKNLR